MVDAVNWQEFQDCIHKMGLKWTFSKRSQHVVFVDLVIKIYMSGRLITSLCAKPLALHLYIPPHSSHAPGVFTGLIFGNVLQIYQLCSKQEDIDNKIKKFMKQLLAWGFSLNKIRPLFSKAAEGLLQYINSTAEQLQLASNCKARAERQHIFLHLPFHPSNLPSRDIQRLWLAQVQLPDAQL
jgi:hypothetical protein